MINKGALLIAFLGLLGSPIYALNFKLQGVLAERGLADPGMGLFSFFLWLYISLGILYLAGIFVVFRWGPFKVRFSQALLVILLFALLYRLFLLPTQPMLSSDMYRYIWDGRVQSQGINPYRYPPNHEAIKRLRDGAIYPHINRKGSPTIYPAGAQALFYILNRLGARSVVTFKGVALLFDMGSIVLLVMILGRLGLQRERVLLYAWNPLVIFELANNGHLDGFVVFFILLCIWFLLGEKPGAAVSALALAASLKLYPVFLLPAVLNEKKVRGMIVFGCVFFVFYLPYLSAGEKILGFLPEYFTNPFERFNLGLKFYVAKLFPSMGHWMMTKIFSGALIVAMGVTWLKKKTDPVDAVKFVYLLVGLQMVLTSASLHPWYVVWIIPFLALFPSPAWLYFSMVVPFAYLKYQSPQGIFPEWVRHMEYIPFFLLLAGEYIILKRSSGRLFPWRSAGERRTAKTSEGSLG